MSNEIFLIDFAKFVSSISLALDLAESCTFKDSNKKIDFEVTIPGFNVYKHNFTSHSKKTALISIFIAKALGYKASRLDNLYIAAFLHDIGAVDAFCSCHENKSFITEHSDFGAKIVKCLPVDPYISDIIRFHHEHFDGSGFNKLDKYNIPEESSIIHVADMFELMYDENLPSMIQREKILSWLKETRGRLFSPDVVDALLSIAKSDRFWLDIENINTDTDILDRMQPLISTPVSLDKLKDIALVFAAIIDKKSKFTHQHSVGLTNHAERFSQYYGFCEEKKTKMEIAALLHDLGKLSVPNHILDKPAGLTKEEYTIIKSHTYYTKLILQKINGMEEIAAWAANHHETLRGSGYPERIGSEELSLESRIIAVCDIYQALTEDRPYRPGMPKEKAVSIIESLVEKGDLDAEVVKTLKEII